MTTLNDALNSLADSGLCDVLKWAAPVAFARTNELYDEDAGHDQGVVGTLNHKHFVDLCDRATANGRFKLGDDVDGLGSDFLERGITPEAFQSMPKISMGAIVRSNYKQSPGWAANRHRVLLQSFTFGKVDEIQWAQRSNAKREVASQRFDGGPTLFDDEDYGLESTGGIPDDDAFDGITLVAAHAYSPQTGQYELYVGQSKNPERKGDSCWHWRVMLLSGGTPIARLPLIVPPALPGDGASTNVDDIDVRIKKPQMGEGSGAANG